MLNEKVTSDPNPTSIIRARRFNVLLKVLYGAGRAMAMRAILALVIVDEVIHQTCRANKWEERGYAVSR